MVYKKKGPAYRRDGIKRDYGPSDVTKSEVEDELAGPKEEEVESPPPEGVEGGTPPPESTSPEPGEGPAAPESPETVELADKFSDEEFISFTTTKKIINSVTETLSLSIKDIQTKALGYKPLNPKSPSFKVRPGKVAAGGANVALGVITVGVWIKGMVDAFEHDEKFLADHVYTYIYSDSKEPSNSKEKSFRAKLSSTLNIRGLAIVSEGAQKISAAKAVAQKSLKASKDEAEKAEIEKGSVKVVKEIRASI
ncbi:hypothetical protein G3M48_005789 [Beauveria asiatica]|uniref:Senescence domain-containing protein n=1 Tax=Beauveria asiatica TaxID=1069075 RepID=A0AAW0RQE2_9HYPO